MRSLLCLFAVLFLCACSGGRVSEAPTAGEVVPIHEPVEDYRLGAGDKVRLLVFNEPALSGEFSVNSNGALSLPLIGDIPAIGKTTAALKAELEQRFAEGYLREPRVSIDVLSFRPFYILGEVSKPGEYPYAAGMTVLNAVATAEGFTYRAEKRYVFIRRAGMEEEQRYKISPTLRVSPGDTIRIGERYF